MTQPPDVVDFFPTAADARNYVRTAASEDALETLQRRVREGRSPAVLFGPPGIGKTLLLRVLQGRLAAQFRVVYLPFAALPADELCAWILGLLDEVAGPDPERDLMAASLRLEGGGSALVVLLDDAGSMPVATARRLSALLNEAEGAIRLVLASTVSERAIQMLSAFEPAPSQIEFAMPMTVEETARYVRAHLVRADAPRAVRERFDPNSISYLHRGSGGIPRVLSGLAGELARGNLAVLPYREAGPRDEPHAVASDPFGVTSDPAAYVPRPATRELLQALEGALREGARSILLTGPPGLGKTMLLRVLEQRLRGEFRPLGISYTALLPDELARWILTQLGEPIAEDPEAALLEVGRRFEASGTKLVLLLDDAGAIPSPTVRRLAELVQETKGAIRLVLTAIDDARARDILAALGPGVETLRLDEPMSEDETAEYIYARLSHARVRRSLIEQFDPDVVTRLHEESEGVARELHKLASELIRESDQAAAIPAARRPARRPPPEPEVEVAPRPAEPTAVAAALPRSEPVPPRIPVGGRVALFGLAVIAGVLAATPLLRAGFPWMPAPWRAESASAPAAPGADTETAPAPASDSVFERIGVNINATPWASIEVDGEYLGVTPLAEVLLAPGSHRFRARMADGQILEQQVEIGPDMRHVIFEVHPIPGRTEPDVAIPETAPEPVAASAPPLRDFETAPVEEVRPPETPPETVPIPEVATPEGIAAPVTVPERETVEIGAEPVPAPEAAPTETVARTEIVREFVPPEPRIEPAPVRETEPPVATEGIREVPEPAPEPLSPAREEPPGGVASVDETLAAREPAPAPAPLPAEPISVSINAVPWATIEIDGEEIGVTPMAGVLLAPGAHRFRVRMADGTILERTVRIAADNRHISFGN